MVRFYGLAPDELDDLPLEEYWMYQQAMDRIEASDRLMQIQASSFPNIDKRKRDKIVNALEKIADPQVAKYKALTHEDMERILNG